MDVKERSQIDNGGYFAMKEAEMIVNDITTNIKSQHQTNTKNKCQLIKRIIEEKHAMMKWRQ